MPQEGATAQQQEELRGRELSFPQQQLQPDASVEEQLSSGEGEEGSSGGVDVIVMPAAPPPAELVAEAAAALAAKKAAAVVAAAAMATEAAGTVTAVAAEGPSASDDGWLAKPQGEETRERGGSCPTEDGSREGGSSPECAKVDPAPAAAPSPAPASASQLPPTPGSQPTQPGLAAGVEAAGVGSPRELAAEVESPFSTEASEATQPVGPSPSPALASATTAAGAAAEQAQRSAAEECERLLSLGEQLSAVQAAMAVAAGGNGNTRVHKQRYEAVRLVGAELELWGMRF